LIVAEDVQTQNELIKDIKNYSGAANFCSLKSPDLKSWKFGTKSRHA
jgi:hypothetical protein